MISIILIMFFTFNTTEPYFKKPFGYGWPSPRTAETFRKALTLRMEDKGNYLKNQDDLSKNLIFEIILVPNLDKYYEIIREKRYQKELENLIMLLYNTFAKYSKQRNQFIIEAISRTWDGDYQFVRPIFLKMASNKQFLEAIRVWQIKYSKPLSIKQLTNLYQEAKKRKMLIWYDVIGDQQIPFYKFRIDHIYIGISPEKKLGIPIRKRIFYELQGIQDYEKITSLLREELNFLLPNQKETVLDRLKKLTDTLFLYDPERQHIEILRKYGAKTYKELQELKKKKEK